MNAAQHNRLRFVDVLLDHYGSINRRLLTDFFGISTPQATLDLRQYELHAPNNMIYDTSLRAYRRTTTYRRTFP